MEILNRITDNRINALNCLIETSLGEYFELSELILKKNQFQRRRVKTSGTIYSLLKSDLKAGIVMPPLVLGLSQDVEIKDKNNDELLAIIGKNTENLLILDGLQRTYTIRDLLNELKESADSEIEVIKKHKLRIEIYLGINKLGILYRMLTLNTGQTPMSSRHQIEIIYSDYIDKSIKDVKLIKQIDKDSPSKLSEFNFNDVIDGFTSYLERDYLTFERSDILDNIKSLEKLATENQGKDLFQQFVSSYNKFAIKLYNLGKDWKFDPDRIEKKLGGAPFATDVIKAFNKSQVMTGFGSAIGKLIDLSALNSFEDVDELIEKIISKNIDQELDNLVIQLDNLRADAKKIGNDQRIFFHYFFRELFDKKSDSYLSLGESISQAYSQYIRRTKE